MTYLKFQDLQHVRVIKDRIFNIIIKYLAFSFAFLQGLSDTFTVMLVIAKLNFLFGGGGWG